MSHYLLDTNVVRQIIRGHPVVIGRLTQTPMDRLTVSSITFAETQFGLAKRPQAVRLRFAIEELFKRVDVLPFGKDEATAYGWLRAALGAAGLGLSPLDTLIAAHAIATGSILVTADQAFHHLSDRIAGFSCQDWSNGPSSNPPA